MDSQPFDVLLIGLGAVGGIYAYVLEKSMKCRVTAIARSLYHPIKTHGLNIKSKKYGETKNWRPYRLTQTAQEAADRNYRFIINCVKCLPDVEPPSNILAPFIASHQKISGNNHSPTVVLIQNGIGIEQPIAEAFPSTHIISCVAWIGANLKTSSSASPNDPQTGPVLEHGVLDQLIMGIYQGEGFAPDYLYNPDEPNVKSSNRFVEGLLTPDGSPLEGPDRQERLQRGHEEVAFFADLIRAGGGNPEIKENIQPTRWIKNLWNGAFSTTCTLSRSAVAPLIAPEVLPYTLPVIRRTMLEILYVGRALGYSESDLPAKAVDEAIQLTIQNYQVKPKVALQVDGSAGADNAIEDDDEDEEEDRKDENPLSVPSFKPSMLIDLENNRPMELEPIVGAVLDRARSKAIETPRLDLIYSVLKVSQEQAVQTHVAKLKTQEQEKHRHFWAMRKPSVGGSGTSDSRQAWLDEVRRREGLGQTFDSANRLGHLPLNSSMPSKVNKVTGKPIP
ncbi:hypothetical protein O181_002616 [Austropuccinia psidii MF-1]|uniref:Uncharacterized protein n=1 Tax=Austropuccinia psidii MF-1 TaxID=1389203 RepID=A0A9Q3BC86_9BASI|nr:hypothetical protein [Austropuccinia psidii MF-1]